MNNLLSYCGLVDASTSASEKDLPITNDYFSYSNKYGQFFQKIHFFDFIESRSIGAHEVLVQGV